MRRKTREKKGLSQIATAGTVAPAQRTRADELIANIKALGDRPIVGVEIGVLRAETSKAILDACPNVMLYLVDRWCPPVPGDSHYTSGSVFATMPQEQFDAYKKTAHHNVARYILEGRAKIIEANSLDSAKQIKNGSVDFVFIDADHSYDGCKADIETWGKKVAPGGFISGHDYGSMKFPGVTQAWNESFPNVATGSDHTAFVDIPYKKARLVSVVFDFPGKTEYAELVEALKNSAAKNMPNADVEIVYLDPPKQHTDPQRTSWEANALKARAWEKIASEASDDLVLVDADLIIRRDLSVLFAHDFDIAFTHRYESDARSREPINTGVVAVRPTEKSKAFFTALRESVDYLMENPEEHAYYWENYRGIQQAALGRVIETADELEAKIKLFPCQIFNASDHEFSYISSETRVVHLKANVRKRIGADISTGKYAIPLALYNKYKKAVE
jgi:hypothetical protein